MKKIAACLLLPFYACSLRQAQPEITVHVIQQHKAISFKGLDEAVMHELQRDSVDWKKVFPVYKMPVDTDDKDYQKPQPGLYTVSGDSLIFKPDTAFVKAQLYFTRFQHYNKRADAGTLLKGTSLLSPNRYQEITFKY